MPQSDNAGTTKDYKEVNEPNAQYKSMMSLWEMIDGLKGGTGVMRTGARKWLPQEPKEKNEAYSARLNRSFLYNGYSNAIRMIIARPFSKNIVLENAENLDEKLEPIYSNADNEGTDLTSLGKELMKEGMDRGIVHLITDYPVTNPDGSLAEEQESGVRPVMIPVSATQVIGWKYEIINGGKTLTQVRIREVKQENVGDFGTRPVKYVRVWTREDWTLYKEDPTSNIWTIDQGPHPHTFGEIPMRTAYLDKIGFMVGKPVLDDLAWMNIAHWQSSSDQRNILRFARCGMIFIKGISEDDREKQSIAMGANQVVFSENSEADMKIVEYSGTAIESGANDLKDLENKMEIMGLVPFVSSKSGNVTATEKAIDEGRQMTDVQAWIQAIEELLQGGYEDAAKWVGVELPEGFEVKIFSDFGIGLRSAADILSLIKLRLANEIPQKHFLNELKRRGLISEEVSVDEMMDAIESELSNMSSAVDDEGDDSDTD